MFRWLFYNAIRFILSKSFGPRAFKRRRGFQAIAKDRVARCAHRSHPCRLSVGIPIRSGDFSAGSSLPAECLRNPGSKQTTWTKLLSSLWRSATAMYEASESTSPFQYIPLRLTLLQSSFSADVTSDFTSESTSDLCPFKVFFYNHYYYSYYFLFL